MLLNNIKRFPILIRFSIFFIIPIFGAVFYFYAEYSGGVAVYDGSAQVNGLEESISIIRSQHGVPTIVAKTDLDAYFGLGFVHAQDRLWQMEIGRRLASGRLGEIMGSNVLDSDKLMRTLGFKKNAIKIYLNLNEDTRRAIDAYTKGVNEAISQFRTLPLEFLLQSTTMDPWEATDSILLYQLMAWRMSGNLAEELKRISLISIVGQMKASELMSWMSDDLSNNSTKPLLKELSGSQNGLRNIKNVFDDISHSQRFNGSNAWVVSGAHTETGGPLLANDPHLGLHSPSIWYLSRVRGARLDIMGASYPGFPFIISGANSNVAWGVTNMGADTVDLRMEKFDVDKPSKYYKDEKLFELQYSEEVIAVRAAPLKQSIPPIRLKIAESSNGPIVSSLFGLKGIYSLSWVGSDFNFISSSIDSFYKLNYASDWVSFTHSLERYALPTLNIVYSDIKGNIGSISSGYIPVRKKGQGAMPSPGWDSRFDLVKFIPFSELPKSYNPKTGFVATANNKVVDDNYPYFITADWGDESRYERISNILSSSMNDNHKFSAKDMIKIQMDTLSLPAKVILKYLVDTDPQTERQKKVIDRLKNWDAYLHSSSVEATIYQAWLLKFNNLLLRDEFDLRSLVGIDQAVALQLLENPDYKFLLKVLKGEDQEWCDNKLTPKVENCRSILLNSLELALNELTQIMGKDMSSWKWGDLHLAHYPHFPFSKKEFSSRAWDSPFVFLSVLAHNKRRVGGDAYTIYASPVYSGDGIAKFATFFGASFRSVIDITNLDNSCFSVSPGISGDIMSSYYSDVSTTLVGEGSTFFSGSAIATHNFELVPREIFVNDKH